MIMAKKGIFNDVQWIVKPTYQEELDYCQEIGEHFCFGSSVNTLASYMIRCVLPRVSFVILVMIYPLRDAYGADITIIHIHNH